MWVESSEALKKEKKFDVPRNIALPFIENIFQLEVFTIPDCFMDYMLYLWMLLAPGIVLFA